MQLLLELPSRAEQIAFKRGRRDEICRDPLLSGNPGRIESNVFGNAIMIPSAAGEHRHRQGEIAFRLRKHPAGLALPECPVSTIDGVRAADEGWFSEERFEQVRDWIAFDTESKKSLDDWTS